VKVKLSHRFSQVVNGCSLDLSWLDSISHFASALHAASVSQHASVH